ncbi:FAD-dependent monooxygenase [Nonomuraea helvata]|uniref:FAD-dependent monooxygenase n=1 Tax=Nonomuraea helvata TaxID=37484 RepID=A0ABV5RRB0_9ACTN
MAIRRSAAKRHGLPSVVQLRLTPTPTQAGALATAIQVCNQAATYISRLAWQQRTFPVLDLHRLAYHQARAHFGGLGAQATVRAIARVAGAYANRRATKKRAHIFRPHGAIPYDARLMTWNRDARIVSLWTPAGRVHISYTGREEDLKALDTLPVGEADLICRKGVWLLQVAVTLSKPAVREPVCGFLGVDQGVANLAVTSDGAVLPGRALPGPIHDNGHVRALRERRYRQRRRLQKKGTSAARRVSELLEGALADPDFYFDALSQARLPSWSKGRVALVGDAAYCASPASGAGAELAVVGAYRLAEELAGASDHRVAFRRYEESHRELVNRKQRIGPNVRMMVPKNHLGMWARNAFATSMGLLSRGS